MARSQRAATGKSQRNTMQHHDPVGTQEGENEAVSEALKSRLAVAENVLATLSVDLDEELRFGFGLVALTDRRLLALEPGGKGVWREWSLADPALELQLSDQSGVALLDLVDGRGRLVRWRYTLAQQVAALRLLRLFGQRANAGVSRVRHPRPMATRSTPSSRPRPRPGCCCGWAASPGPTASN